MAYPEVTDQCIEREHDACPGGHPLSPEDQAEGVCGGGFCVCYCHHESFNWKWYEQVYASSVQSRENVVR